MVIDVSRLNVGAARKIFSRKIFLFVHLVDSFLIFLFCFIFLAIFFLKIGHFFFGCKGGEIFSQQ